MKVQLSYLVLVHTVLQIACHRLIISYLFLTVIMCLLYFVSFFTEIIQLICQSFVPVISHKQAEALLFSKVVNKVGFELNVEHSQYYNGQFIVLNFFG